MKNATCICALCIVVFTLPAYSHITILSQTYTVQDEGLVYYSTFEWGPDGEWLGGYFEDYYPFFDQASHSLSGGPVNGGEFAGAAGSEPLPVVKTKKGVA